MNFIEYSFLQSPKDSSLRAKNYTSDKWCYGDSIIPSNRILAIESEVCPPRLVNHRIDKAEEINTSTIGICTFKKDSQENLIYSGDVLQNDNGQIFEVRFGNYAMYCPVDNTMMENVGFFTVSNGIYEDMPLGPTEEYATIIGNIYDNPEYRVDEKFRCIGEENLATLGRWYREE